ncbi:hypothetical protein AAE478_008305 [Parahypoxylon ruwenzoriense]
MSSKYAFTKALKEVRFLFCHSGEGSAATRTFLTRAYPTMKKNNPYTPILLREAAGTLPKVYARYGPFPPTTPSSSHSGNILTNSSRLAEFGKETSKSLEGLTDKQIEEAVTQLVKGDA